MYDFVVLCDSYIYDRYRYALRRPTGDFPDTDYVADCETDARAQFKRQLIRYGFPSDIAEDMSWAAQCSNLGKH